MKNIRSLFLFGFLFLGAAPTASAQPDANEQRISKLEQRISKLDHDVKDVGGTGAISILFGAFCALWAQNTGRSAWLWFFLGLFFSVITVIVLLVKNSNDNFEIRMFGRTSRTPPPPPPA